MQNVSDSPSLPFSTQSSALSPQHSVLVGRESELTQLHGWLAKALNSERQIVFVTGEPGIGKTTLVEAFLSGARSHQKVVSSQQSAVSREETERQRAKGKGQKAKVPNPKSQIPNPGAWMVGRGQCIEHYGVGEAYLPILEALGRLCREPGRERLRALLRQHAPTWLVQMPGLLSASDLEALQRKTVGTTRERMLREFAEALEVIAAGQPLILCLEDLHWSDVSTLDLLSMLARRQEAARLLIIGTYRPVEVLTREHPLKAIKQELQLHGQCEELALDFLSEGAVEEYLARRTETERKQDRPLAAVLSPQETIGMPQLARIIHRRTDGNPLFMVNLVDHLLSQGVLVQADEQWRLKNEDLATTVPENLRQLIEQQLARVNPEQRKILEAASVAGAEFSTTAVTAGVETTVETVEEQCEELARREQFLRTRGTSEWPDGMVAARYGFVHALYQEVLYAQISASRRTRLHRQIGEREEIGYGERAREIAAELAVHFERGRDYRKAVQYLQHAGENALRRSANQEAISHLTKGLELLKTLPDTPERAQQELRLQVALGTPLQATKGYAAPEVEDTYTRARELCRQLGDTPQLFQVMLGLQVFFMIRAELQTARELAEQCLSLAQRGHSPARRMWAHQLLGITLLFLGEFALAHGHLEQGMALYDLQKHTPLVSGAVQDPGVSCLCYGAWALWSLGYPDRALQRSREALTLAPELSHPFSLAYALYHAASLHQLRLEGQAAKQRAESSIRLSTEQGFTEWVALGTILRGWALAEQGQGEEGVALIRQGIAAYRATGSELLRPHFLALLAEAYGRVGQAEEGLGALAEALALVDKTGERSDEAELYRLRGELTLAQSQASLGQVMGKSKASQKSKGKGQKSKIETNPQPLTPSTQEEVEQEAEACFLKAIDIAQKQQAKSLELRAVMSLVRLRQHRARDLATRNTDHASRNRLAEALKMLSTIYNWFTEGLDTKDLQEAQALLDSLESQKV
jgi:predicted ATPase